jgi:uncharacterized protein (TIGR02246 family)
MCFRSGVTPLLPLRRLQYDLRPISSGYLHTDQTVVRRDAACLLKSGCHTMMKVRRAALALMLFTGAQALASDDGEAQIHAALMRWTAAFNARDTSTVCDLFARDLRYDFRGARERGYNDICELLGRSLTDPSTRYTYSPAIKEILVAGDLAIVRLVWTLRTRKVGGSEDATTEETGLDVFRKQPDGSWKIIRYIAYD